MGVSIPDIRKVVHWGVSKSILSYWQEVGKCGRDSLASEAFLYATGASLDKRRTDEDMIRLCKELKDPEQCVRRKILNNLTIDGMDVSQLKRLSERQSCTRKCRKCSVYVPYVAVVHSVNQDVHVRNRTEALHFLFQYVNFERTPPAVSMYRHCVRITANISKRNTRGTPGSLLSIISRYCKYFGKTLVFLKTIRNSEQWKFPYETDFWFPDKS